MDDDDLSRRTPENDRKKTAPSAGARFSLMLIGFAFVGSILCMCAFVFALALAS